MTARWKMAQCDQCNAPVADTAQFCPSCGLRLPRPAKPAEAAAEAGPSRWRRGRRVVIAFLLAVVGLAAVFIATVVYLIRNTTIVTSGKGGSSRVEAPFGVVTTSNDPAKLARSLAIDIYPRAVGDKSAQADLVTDNMVSLLFHSSDPPRRVISFYHVRYPDATVKPIAGGGYSLVQLNGLDTLTIQATPEKGQTRIAINDIRR